MSRGGAEEEGISQAGSALSAQPDMGLKLTTLRSRPEPKSRKSRVPCLTD